MADVRVVAKGGAVQILGQLTQRASRFCSWPSQPALLGTAGYGVYRQVFQTLVVATTLAAGGFPSVAVRFIAQARASGDPGGARGAARVALGGAAVASFICLWGEIFSWRTRSHRPSPVRTDGNISPLS